MFTIAAPSKTTVSTEGCLNVVLTSTNDKLRFLPWHESAGGLELFSGFRGFPLLLGKQYTTWKRVGSHYLRSAT